MEKIMKLDIYKEIKELADYEGLSILELLTNNYVKTADASNDTKSLVTFDSGKTYYNSMDIYYLYIEIRHQMYLDSFQ